MLWTFWATVSPEHPHVLRFEGPAKVVSFDCQSGKDHAGTSHCFTKGHNHLCICWLTWQWTIPSPWVLTLRRQWSINGDVLCYAFWKRLKKMACRQSFVKLTSCQVWAKTGPLRWLLSSHLPCAIGEVVGAETNHGSEAVSEGSCLMLFHESIDWINDCTPESELVDTCTLLRSTTCWRGWWKTMIKRGKTASRISHPFSVIVSSFKYFDFTTWDQGPRLNVFFQLYWALLYPQVVSV